MSQYEAGIIPHSAHTLDVVEDAVGEAGLVLAPGPGDGEKCLPSSSSRRHGRALRGLLHDLALRVMRRT